MDQLKFDVTIPNDIQACHRVNKSVLIRVWNRKEGSAWSRINEGLKSGVNPDLNVYYNYQLTNRRSEMKFKEFEPRFKSAKTRFKLSAGLNLEKFDTILSGNNHI